MSNPREFPALKTVQKEEKMEQVREKPNEMLLNVNLGRAEPCMILILFAVILVYHKV